MCFQFAKSLLVFSFFLSLPLLVWAQTPTILELNRPIDREIKTGETHRFQVNLTANRYAKIILEQRSVDVAAKVTVSDGNEAEIIRFDDELKTDAAEIIAIVSEKRSTFEIEVRTANPKSIGKYKIFLQSEQTPTQKDSAKFKAHKLLQNAVEFGQNGKIDEGFVAANNALEVLNREFESDSFEIGKCYFVIGRLYYEKNDLTKAEEFLVKSLKIFEDSRGKESLSLISPLLELGSIYDDQENYGKAEEYIQRRLRICEKELPPMHLRTADTLNNLAIVQKRSGRLDKAEKHYLQALNIRETLLGGESLEVSDTLMDLALVYDSLQKSEPLLLRALSIQEKEKGSDDIDVARTLYNLGQLYLQFDQFAKAEPHTRRSLAILEAKLGPNHPFTGYPSQTLALIDLNLGKFDEAEKLYKRSVENANRINSERNPKLALALNTLGDFYAVTGDLKKALECKTRANEIINQIFLLNIFVGSEQEKLGYLRSLDRDKDRTLSFAFQYAPTSSEAAAHAALLIFRQKGRVLDSLSDSLNSLRSSLAEEDQDLLDKWNNQKKQLSETLLTGQSKMSVEDYKTKIAGLTEENDALERLISRKTSGFFNNYADVSVSEIQKSIPENAVVLEFTSYTPLSLKSIQTATSKPRYSVFILSKDGGIKSKDLGEKASIDQTILKFREALQDSKRTDIKQLAQDLEKKIMFPILKMMGDSNQLLISPDGDLNLIPFEALVDESGKYLVEKYSISYLSSGRDLLRIQNSKPNSNSPLIIANPNFGIAETSVHSEEQQQAKRNIKDKKRGVTVAKSLSETYFAPLSGTEQEGKTIQTLFPESILLTGTKATKDALKSTKSPKILHIASHGFYLEDKDKSDTGNPLLRSGIALAGANTRNSNNGIVTALEASGLNLFGTKLVVLSACGTGLGEVQSGEGVFGLRRSFVLAGSESLVISLWSVSDYITRDLMTNYYKNLKLGNGRSESLRKVQLEMLKNPKRKHPFYWASFIQSGNWKALDN